VAQLGYIKRNSEALETQRKYKTFSTPSTTLILNIHQSSMLQRTVLTTAASIFLAVTISSLQILDHAPSLSSECITLKQNSVSLFRRGACYSHLPRAEHALSTPTVENEGIVPPTLDALSKSKEVKTLGKASVVLPVFSYDTYNLSDILKNFVPANDGSPMFIGYHGDPRMLRTDGDGIVTDDLVAYSKSVNLDTVCFIEINI
jgi:hypothetical protein